MLSFRRTKQTSKNVADTTLRGAPKLFIYLLFACVYFIKNGPAFYLSISFQYLVRNFLSIIVWNW